MAPKPVKTKKNEAVASAVLKGGGLQEVAQKLDVSPVAVFHWIYRACPPERAVDLERISGVDREKMRPDIFGDN